MSTTKTTIHTESEFQREEREKHEKQMLEMRERLHGWLNRNTLNHPMTRAVFELLNMEMPGVARADAPMLAVLMGLGHCTGNRTKAWLKVAEDLIDDLAQSDPEIFSIQWIDGRKLLSVRFPDEELKQDPQPAEWPIAGYGGPQRTPIRVIPVDDAGEPLPAPNSH